MAVDGSNPTRIMVAVNESNVLGYPHASTSSRGAFEWTLDKIIRNNYSGFKLLFLHVEVPDIGGFDGSGITGASRPHFNNEKCKDLGTRGFQLLEYFIKKCNEIGVACEACARIGDPKEVICDEVKRVQPDFLVVGSRGLGPFQKVFIGTVSEFCVKHAECPVIAIKRSQAQTPADPAED